MAELDFASPPRSAAENAPLAAVMSRETNGPASPAASLSTPLRSDEAFTTYCSQVQGRLKERAVARRQFLQGAYDRLTTLLHAALAVEDQSLYNELWQHRVAAKELLEAALRVTDSAPAPEVSPPALSPVSVPVASAQVSALSTPAPPLENRENRLDNRVENYVAPHSAPYENGSTPTPPASYPASHASNGVIARDAAQPNQPPFSSSYAPPAYAPPAADYNAPTPATPSGASSR